MHAEFLAGRPRARCATVRDELRSRRPVNILTGIPGIGAFADVSTEFAVGTAQPLRRVTLRGLRELQVQHASSACVASPVAHSYTPSLSPCSRHLVRAPLARVARSSCNSHHVASASRIYARCPRHARRPNQRPRSCSHLDTGLLSSIAHKPPSQASYARP